MSELTRPSGWAGHWRGKNGTDETVICDLSYTSRRSLTSMCGRGYTVADSPTNTFWASDLLHRLYHMPAFGYGYIEHYIDDYDDALAYAANGTTTNTHDSDVLQYFALDAYAYDIAVPGTGCTGGTTSASSSEEVAGSTISGPAAAQMTSASASASTAASPTSSAPAVGKSSLRAPKLTCLYRNAIRIAMGQFTAHNHSSADREESQTRLMNMSHDLPSST